MKVKAACVYLLAVLSLAFISILASAPACAFFDDFEGEEVGEIPLNWTPLWQPLTVAGNGGAFWSSKFLRGPSMSIDDQMATVNGLILGDCRIEVDHINVGDGGGQGGSGMVILRCQGDRHNALYLNLLGSSIYFHLKASGDPEVSAESGPALGAAYFNDGKRHSGESYHVAIEARGTQVTARASLIGNPSIYAETLVNIPNLWPTGSVGLLINERSSPPYISGFDNFRAEPLLGKLSGYITLSDWNMSKTSLVPIEVELTPISGGVAKKERIYLDATDPAINYTVDQVTPGTYNISYSACKWLKKSIYGVVITGKETAIQDITLVNGDLNGDNAILDADNEVINKNWGQTGDS